MKHPVDCFHPSAHVSMNVFTTTLQPPHTFYDILSLSYCVMVEKLQTTLHCENTRVKHCYAMEVKYVGEEKKIFIESVLSIRGVKLYKYESFNCENFY